MESAFIDWLRQRTGRHPNLWLGPGDDACILRLGDDGQRADPGHAAGRRAARAVVTTDMLTEGVDFRLAVDSPRRIGRKALAVNLSDLAAMAAVPVACLISVALPRGNSLDLAKELFTGIADLADEFGVAISGGDTNSWDGPLVISITALGEPGVHGPLLRSAAKVGDRVLVTGALGGSILGHQFDFTPRIAEGLELARLGVRAGMDISDGLSLDASRLAKESGVGISFDLATIPIAPAAHALVRERPGAGTALDHALADGEDFELLVTAAPDVATKLLAEWSLATPLTAIGWCVAEPGLFAVDATGRRQPLEPRGYEHQF